MAAKWFLGVWMILVILGAFFYAPASLGFRTDIKDHFLPHTHSMGNSPGLPDVCNIQLALSEEKATWR